MELGRSQGVRGESKRTLSDREDREVVKQTVNFFFFRDKKEVRKIRGI